MTAKNNGKGARRHERMDPKTLRCTPGTSARRVADRWFTPIGWTKEVRRWCSSCPGARAFGRHSHEVAPGLIGQVHVVLTFPLTPEFPGANFQHVQFGGAPGVQMSEPAL